MTFTPDTWIALAALLVSVGSVLFTWVTSRRLNRLQAEVAQAELRKHQEEEEWARHAAVRVRLQKDPDQFVVWNEGGAEARDVDLQIRRPDGESDPIEQARRYGKLPIPRLRPGDEYGIGAFVLGEHAITFEVKVTWIDPDGAECSDEESLRTWFPSDRSSEGVRSGYPRRSAGPARGRQAPGTRTR